MTPLSAYPHRANSDCIGRLDRFVEVNSFEVRHSRSMCSIKAVPTLSPLVVSNVQHIDTALVIKSIVQHTVTDYLLGGHGNVTSAAGDGAPNELPPLL